METITADNGNPVVDDDGEPAALKPIMDPANIGGEIYPRIYLAPPGAPGTVTFPPDPNKEQPGYTVYPSMPRWFRNPNQPQGSIEEDPYWQMLNGLYWQILHCPVSVDGKHVEYERNGEVVRLHHVIVRICWYRTEVRGDVTDRADGIDNDMDGIVDEDIGFDFKYDYESWILVKVGAES